MAGWECPSTSVQGCSRYLLWGGMHSHRDRWEVLIPMWSDQGMRAPLQSLFLWLCLPGVCTGRSPSLEMEVDCCLCYSLSNEAMKWKMLGKGEMLAVRNRIQE